MQSSECTGVLRRPWHAGSCTSVARPCKGRGLSPFPHTGIRVQSADQLSKASDNSLAQAVTYVARGKRPLIALPSIYCPSGVIVGSPGSTGVVRAGGKPRWTGRPRSDGNPRFGLCAMNHVSPAQFTITVSQKTA